ncbi:MAG: tRNA lysidine(34) synthetase TilS [Cytophagales bacterium]|nr:tRNA lysidine(34) synthetase TilS [Cytophagales bacterium]
MTNFEDMQAELQAFIQQRKLFKSNDHLLIAVSGGVDSMTLLHLLVQLGYQVSVAHMNFGLRGEASDQDEALVTEICNLLHVPVFTKRVATVDYANEQGISIQMAARELRYRWFMELEDEHHFAYVATAHNADDNLETVLFNLTKGTGIRGISGINHRSGIFVRPLLFAEKSQIIAFAEANGIRWREDASNTEVKYARNKIRHEVLPVLKAINPSVIAHFENTRLRISGTEQVLMDKVQSIREQHTSMSEGIFYINHDWMTGQEVDAVILSELLREFDFSFSQCLDISKAADQSGKLFYSEKFLLNINRGQFMVKPKVESVGASTIAIEVTEGTYQIGDRSLRVTEHPVESFKKGSAPHEVYLDADAVQLPLIIRQWEQGDAFQPLGMKGKKKISDFLVDQKVPLIDKTAVLVLESDATICWVVNHRLDDRFKVTDKTQKVLKITCQKSFDQGPNTV